MNAAIRTVERKRLEAEPHQIDALLAFAARAYRRPLSAAERDDLRGFYRSLREKSSLTHEEAMRDLIVNVLMSPHFNYRVDAAAGTARTTAPVSPLTDHALASRLSYFLWSSMPDAELSARAAAGELRNESVLLVQVRRMVKDERARRLATEFGGNWLDFRRFDEHNAVDRERYPEFSNELRDAMFQSRFGSSPMSSVTTDRCSICCTAAHVRQSHSGQALWDPGVVGSAETWRRIDNARDYQRGGLLPMAAFLTHNSPACGQPRKTRLLVARRVLGEVIPPSRRPFLSCRRMKRSWTCRCGVLAKLVIIPHAPRAMRVRFVRVDVES